MNTTDSLHLLKQNLKLPVIAAPMFLISGTDLVTACCQAGVIGSFPSLNCRTSQEFKHWLEQIKASLDSQAAAYAVNLIVHKTNPRLEADLAICVEHRVPLVITSLGTVKQVVDAVHSYTGLVFHDVINVAHASKAIEAGVDGLILVSAGAGGHTGRLNPLAFIAEIRHFFQGPIILAGSISQGQDIASAVQMGADFAYMGTRFINTQESMASVDYRQMICDSNSSDIIATNQISGVEGNFLKKSLEQAGILQRIQQKSAPPDQHQLGQKLASGDQIAAWKTIWSAGHGVAGIEDSPTTQELVNRLQQQFQRALKQHWQNSQAYLS